MRFVRSSYPQDRRQVTRGRAPGAGRRRAGGARGPTVLRGPAIERRGAGSRVLSVERRLVLLLRPFWRQVVAGLAVTIGMTLVGLATPWPTKILVDDVFGEHRLWGLSQDAALAISVGL